MTFIKLVVQVHLETNLYERRHFLLPDNEASELFGIRNCLAKVIGMRLIVPFREGNFLN